MDYNRKTMNIFKHTVPLLFMKYNSYKENDLRMPDRGKLVA